MSDHDGASTSSDSSDERSIDTTSSSRVSRNEEDNDSDDSASQQQQRHRDFSFFRAILRQPPEYEAAKRALHRGANVNAEFASEGIFPIDIASVNSDAALMRFLITHGADCNQRAFDGMSPLHRAVIFGHYAMVELLLEFGRANPDLKTVREGQESVTSLQMIVAQGGNVAIAKSLVDHGADVHVRRANGRTLLHLVESAEMLDFLLAQGLDVEETRNNGCTALHHACVLGLLPIVKGLIAAGGDPNSLSNHFFSPLHYACHEGHMELVRWLVSEGGGDPYARGDNGCVALHVACLTKQTEVALWLIDKCDMMPSLTNHKGYDALHYACKHSRDGKEPSEIVRELMKRDADLGKGDPYSVPTALHFAAEWNPDLCLLLVKEYGFDLMARSVLGSIPLCHATSVGTVDTIHCLIDLMQENGHDLNVGDVRGLTCLHEAILGGSLEKVHALLNRGLNVNAVSECGETPLHAASLTVGNVRQEHGDERAAECDNEQRRQAEILQAVIDRGAYALHLDRDNMFPFMYSAKKGNLTKTFLIMRAAASQGFFGNPAVDSTAQKQALKRKGDDATPSHQKRLRL